MDESGTFSGHSSNSISVVGVLAIPDGKLPLVRKKYEKIRNNFRRKGEVKGRDLNEKEISDVITMLRRNQVIYEASVMDGGLSSKDSIINFKNKHTEILKRHLNGSDTPENIELKDIIYSI